MTIGIEPVAAASQGGPIQIGPIVTGWWKPFHASSQPSATGLSLTRPSASSRATASARSV